MRLTIRSIFFEASSKGSLDPEGDLAAFLATLTSFSSVISPQYRCPSIHPRSVK